jgi:RNA polymerase sigma-70 factor (ECF subfamily)
MSVTADKINIRAQSLSSDFEQVFIDHWSMVYQVILRLVGDRDEAQDLALETFWQLYNRPPAIQENLPGWLYRVALNLGGSLLEEDKLPPLPEDELVIAERRTEVQEVLSKMKPRSAKLLILRHSGMTYAQLAEVLEIKPTSVGKMLARAQDEFEALFNQVEGGE